MLAIGFSWIIIPCVAAIFVTKMAPGVWEDRGPTVFMLTSVTAAFFGILFALVTEGINGFGPASSAPWTGIAVSALGGLVAFVAYAGYVRRVGPA